MMESFDMQRDTAGGASFDVPEIFAEFDLLNDGLDETASDADEALEKAPPMEVQALMVRDYFVERPELQFENWRGLDVDQRLAALNDLERCVAEAAKRPAVTVESERLPPTTMGYCLSEEHQQRLVLNEVWLERDDLGSYRETLDTLFHEGRHAYQNYNIAGNEVEQNKALIEAWRDNIELWDGYTHSDRPSDYMVDRYRDVVFRDGVDLKAVIRWIFPPYSDLGFEEYYLQPVEVDARMYAECMIDRLGI